MHRTTPRLPFVVASAALLLLTLSACGGSDESATSGASAPDAQAGQSSPPMGSRPGASGTIAAVSGKTMQVQSQQSGQVAVTWTSKTSFTQQVKASLADVRKGGCVVVTAEGDGSAAAGSAPVSAAVVQISKATKGGACTGGFGGDRRGGASARPSDAPTDMPSGAPSGGAGRGFGGGAIGQVTAVGDDGFTVRSSLPGGSSGTPTEVTVSSTTTYSTTGKATAAAVRTGGCATAVGDSDSTGAITATQVSLTAPVDGRCGMGFPGGGQGGPGAGQGS